MRKATSILRDLAMIASHKGKIEDHILANATAELNRELAEAYGGGPGTQGTLPLAPPPPAPEPAKKGR